MGKALTHRRPTRTVRPAAKDPNPVQPADDGPRCACGGTLTPAVLSEGLTKPVDLPQSGDITHLQCSASKQLFFVADDRAAHAWWAVGAVEQRKFDELEDLSA